MKSTLQTIGEKMKYYRKMKGYTLDEFADKIHKSKSTVSKYENGGISIDIITLVEISNVLGIRISQLVEDELAESKNATLPEFKNPFFNTHMLYLYYYDGKKDKISKGLITIHKNFEENIIDAHLYLNILTVESYMKCDHLYYGKFEQFDLLSRFVFENQSIAIEKVLLCIINPFNSATKAVALLSGISSRTLMPVAMKCILSKVPLSEDKELKEHLRFTADELRNAKKYNNLAVNNDL